MLDRTKYQVQIEIHRAQEKKDVQSTHEHRGARRKDHREEWKETRRKLAEKMKMFEGKAHKMKIS